MSEQPRNLGSLPPHGDDAGVGGEGLPAELNPIRRKLTNGVGSVFAHADPPRLGFQRFDIRERHARQYRGVYPASRVANGAISDDFGFGLSRDIRESLTGAVVGQAPPERRVPV
jgi:hypothetical protein